MAVPQSFSEIFSHVGADVYERRPPGFHSSAQVGIPNRSEPLWAGRAPETLDTCRKRGRTLPLILKNDWGMIVPQSFFSSRASYVGFSRLNTAFSSSYANASAYRPRLMIARR